jgi:S-adenosylmethionine hydrolase
MKVAMYARLPNARIVDLTHDLPAFRPAAGAFWLDRCRRWCPPGTVHVAVVDPGVGTSRRLLTAIAGGQVFVGPDNGLLGTILAEPDAIAREIDAATRERLGFAPASATFHGRDILAPIAAELAGGRIGLAHLGPAVKDWVPSPLAVPVARDGGLDGEVLLLDRFGNAFTNLPAGAAARLRRPTLAVLGHRLPIVRTYGEAAEGSAVAVANSFGVLEVAVVAGDAGRTIPGLEPGVPVRLAEG